MITREEAAAIAADTVFGDHRDTLASLARTVVALYDERDALALELRRLRATEAPGTDDGAVAPWVWNADIRSWMHDGWFVTATGRFWRADAHHTLPLDPAAIALDAMRAAVPGSV